MKLGRLRDARFEELPCNSQVAIVMEMLPWEKGGNPIFGSRVTPVA